MLKEFKLPDLGEGLKEATLVEWNVKEGDVVKADQAIAEVETDKATTPLPSPFAGKVVKLHGNPGDVIKVGAVIVQIETEGGGSGGKTAEEKPKEAKSEKAAKEEEKSKPAAKSDAANAKNGRASDSSEGNQLVLATPATRRLAREKGIDIRQVPGTGPGGRVTAEDVEAVASGKRPATRMEMSADLIEGVGTGAAAGGVARPDLPDFSNFGPIKREKASAIRRRIAQRMALSQSICATVTHIDEADITDLEMQRHAGRDAAEKAGFKLTLLPILVKACIAALKEFPAFNSTFDDEKGEVILKHYYHIGVAVDSPQGLLVPVLRDADKKSSRKLAEELVGLAEAARTGKITADQMRGGSFTITNIGAIGGLGFTPVINWPEVAIIGVGRTQERLVRTDDGEIEARLFLPLCLSFDHRLIDGADAARFMNYIKSLLENPLLLLAEI